MKKVLPAIFCVFVAMPLSAGAEGRPDVFEAMQTKLRYLTNRQSVISQNIANANTPNYKAKDLESVDFNAAPRRQSRMGLVATDPGHIRSVSKPISFEVVKQKDAYETAPNGNNVVLEQQTVKMSENNLEYQTTLNLMRKMNRLVRTAIGDNSQ